MYWRFWVVLFLASCSATDRYLKVEGESCEKITVELTKDSAAIDAP
jgi:hypothetical protein